MSGAPTVVAVLTPMANPTVEAEMRQLLPPDLAWVTGRLVSDEADSQRRLIAYAEQVGDSLRQFDTLAPAPVAFACTASGYLIGAAREREIAATLDVPILWATAAIAARIAALGARRIALVSPYPDPVHAAGLAYWRARGLDIVHDERVEIGSADTRAIYALGASAAAGAVARAKAAGPELVLLSGTGMPTLAHLAPQGDPPVISSNHCLALALIEAVRAGETP